ncbi:lipid A export permease/ATP-binding protein MsbA [Marinobacterium sedimentorum]|uniref:lipid A export permease/ATP-binding protein MsbA n=1 Tax=Marinobacterium sedimentorum TaxID=2927804 RepID=UPI0020C670FE|nr:lipid A export permease/ATP-binding protein MsbA [Marinobacterium sedimentorum]MCP8686252.1 lipid A export permease/ATP-binding protein MsbA [Marinobacterium sedimentorum]
MSKQQTPTTELSSWMIYQRLLVYVKPYWFAFVVSFIAFGLYGASQALSAKWLEHVVDAVEKGALDQRGVLALAVLGIFALRGIGTFVGTYSISHVARQVVHGLRTDLFDCMLALPSSYYQHSTSGELLAKLTYNVEQVTGAVTEAIKTLLREGLTVIGLFGYLFYLNWKLTLIFIAAAPLIAVVVTVASRRMRKLSRRLQKSVGDITSAASEAIKGYQIVRIFGGTKFERQRFHDASDHNRRQFMKMVVTQSLNTPVVQFLIALALAGLLYTAMHPDVMGGMSTGQFVAFLTAAGLITKPLRQLTDISTQVQKGIAAAESVFAVMDEAPEKDAGQHQVSRVHGELGFDKVGFRYPGADGVVLHELDLQVRPGQTVALVGRSGSGKSTLASLIPRFNDGWTGRILLDGTPLQDYQLANLREQIALVNQQVVLFNGTIAQNIAYGAMADCSEAEIEAAAEAAHVMEFAARLPKRLHTPVGESGLLLSGGQRQRIAIARAILKNAPILILDEATSALDTESERHIQDALDQVIKGRTTLVIAHRLSTVEKADLILVLDQGRIVEQGSHAQLIECDGAYAQLHRMQFADS